jgi:hypothetical protein
VVFGCPKGDSFPWEGDAMRQFRTNTDAVFDIDDEDEGTREPLVVPQPGPPAAEAAGPRTPDPRLTS